MEIGEHRADNAKFEAWINEYVCLAFAGNDPSSTFLRGMFHGANDSRPHSDNATTIRKRAIHSICAGATNLVALDMQRVHLYNFFAQRLKRSEANVEGDLNNVNVPVPDLIQNLRRKVKPCCRGCC